MYNKIIGNRNDFYDDPDLNTMVKTPSDASVEELDIPGKIPPKNDSPDLDETVYYSMFADDKSHFSEENELLRKMANCLENKETELKLNGEIIGKIPEGLKSFIWLETLYIERTKVTVLENIPPNIKTLICRGNKIKILDGSVLPNCLKILTFVGNECIEIVGLKEGIIELSLEDNNLRNLYDKIPNSVVTLDLSKNMLLKNIPKFSDNLRKLIINRTGVSNIDSLNDNIQFLETCNCFFSIIKNLPKNLIIWKSYISGITSIRCDFPGNLVELDLYNNSLVSVPKLPNAIRTVDLANNELKHIPVFPSTIESIDLKKNKELNIKELEQLKKTLSDTVKILYTEEQETINTFNLFGENLFAQHNRARVSAPVTHSKYSSENPHYIVLKKVYRI